MLSQHKLGALTGKNIEWVEQPDFLDIVSRLTTWCDRRLMNNLRVSIPRFLLFVFEMFQKTTFDTIQYLYHGPMTKLLRRRWPEIVSMDIPGKNVQADLSKILDVCFHCGQGVIKFIFSGKREAVEDIKVRTLFPSGGPIYTKLIRDPTTTVDLMLKIITLHCWEANLRAAPVLLNKILALSPDKFDTTYYSFVHAFSLPSVMEMLLSMDLSKVLPSMRYFYLSCMWAIADFITPFASMSSFVAYRDTVQSLIKQHNCEFIFAPLTSTLSLTDLTGLSNDLEPLMQSYYVYQWNEFY